MTPYQSQLIPIPINENINTTLLVHSHPNVSQNSLPLLNKVRDHNHIYLPFANNTKGVKVFKTGTIVGTYERFDASQSQERNEAEVICNTRELQNDLLPNADQANTSGSRFERLCEMVKQQNWSHLSREQKKGLKAAILEHNELFILDKNELGLMTGSPAKINVDDPRPSRGPSYRYPEEAKAIISEMLEDMEDRKIIERSTSAWLSPIVLVNKPDGSKRMCLDYRHVNKHLSTDIYPLPRLEELVEQAAGNEFYATLDMREAYFQILLDKNSRDLTTFTDGVTFYRFRRLPFELSCSPAIFSCHMANLLSPLIKAGWIKNYLDDLII